MLTAFTKVGFAWIPSLAHADPYFVLPVVAALIAVWSGGYKLTPRALTFVLKFALPSGLAIYSIAAQLTQTLIQKHV